MLCRTILLLLVMALTGCSTTVHNRSELFLSKPDVKQCYSYDTLEEQNARLMPTSIALGLVGGLLPPLMIVTIPAAAVIGAADEARLPTKCELSFDEAYKEAWMFSHYERATAIWKQKIDGASIIAFYANDEGNCSKHKIKSMRKDGDKTKDYTEEIKVCRNTEGRAEIVSNIGDVALKSISP